MSKKILFFTVSIIVLLCAVTVIFFTLGGLELFNFRKKQELQHTRLIIPGETAGEFESPAPEEFPAGQEIFNAKISMGDGEVIVSAVNQDFNNDSVEDQFLAYRSMLETEGPVYAAYIEYDASGRIYKRKWSAPSAATRPGTVSLFTQDLVGDRIPCVIITGMNGRGEHTMTIFRWNRQDGTSADEPVPFVKIAELRIDGSIRVQETERSQAYQLGISGGQSFTIAAYGHNTQSENMLDQTEIIYSYNPQSGLYEQSRTTRIPGSQVEQRRLRELLSGQPGVFEGFVSDLWYYVSPQGTLDSRQYIYFDPASRELIFYGDETQQVFVWQNSTPTRYGLYISSQNISVSTLRRFIDIELESLDSIRVKVFEDVRLKIGVSASWDGSYRRAGTAAKTRTRENSIKPYIGAAYDSSMGRLQFFADGNYTLSSGAQTKEGSYIFFLVSGQELLELRPARAAPGQGGGDTGRMVYRVDRTPQESAESISLTRIRLGTAGIEDLHEGTIPLTPAENPG